MALSHASVAPGSRALRLPREMPVTGLLLLALAWMAATTPAFYRPDNLAQVGQEAGLIGIMACGQAVVILTGGIDLSVGALLGASACVCGWLLSRGVPPAACCAAGLVAGGVLGGLNGALITRRRLPPILVTLSGLMLFRAGASIATGSIPFNHLPPVFTAIGKGFLPLAVFVAVAIAFAVTMSRGRFGRHVVAVGGSELAARLSGVSVDGVLRRVYTLSGLCAALAGLLMAAAANNAHWNLADGWELEVIAAAVIGGVRLTGGEGSVPGAALGAVLVVVLRNALFLHHRPVEQYGVVTGAVILCAALAEQARRTRARR